MSDLMLEKAQEESWFMEVVEKLQEYGVNERDAWQLGSMITSFSHLGVGTWGGVGPS